MAEVKAKQGEELAIDLRAPGLTPMLRAGLGGLAASIRAIGEGEPSAWPTRVALGPGEASVESNRVVLRWNGDEAGTLRALFEGSFRIREGLIYLPGAWREDRWDVIVAAALQSGYKRTFLQHGRTTKKEGALRPRQIELDDRTLSVTYQPYSSFAHKEAFIDVVKGLRSGSIALAGWANPGAVDRHIAFKDAEWTYSPSEALCGIFAIVGCLCFQVPQSGGAGALVIPEPSNLLKFAETRAKMGPIRVEDVYMAGASDALLAVTLQLRMEQLIGSAVACAQAVTFRATPWASQQKSRITTVSLGQTSNATLDTYAVVAKTLPVRIIVKRNHEEGGDEGGTGYFAATSAFRGFIADNLANGRRWYEGFATAKTEEKLPRILHRYRTKDDSLGALRAEERKGLIAMTKHLGEAEAYLVRSVHIALRQRFGAIADESRKEAPATMKNRFKGERDKWRIMFAGAKTQEQTRAALAELWGRAGANAELQAHWQDILPLLRADHWQASRDLALIALASYQGKGAQEGDDDEGSEARSGAEATTDEE